MIWFGIQENFFGAVFYQHLSVVVGLICFLMFFFEFACVFYPCRYYPFIISIFTYLYIGYQPNVGKYSIHGWYGIVWGCGLSCTNSLYRWSSPCRCGPTMAPRPVKVLVGKVLVASSKLDQPPWTPEMIIKTDRELDNSTTCRTLAGSLMIFFNIRSYPDYIRTICWWFSKIERNETYPFLGSWLHVECL